MASQSLKGCTIALSGTFESSHAKLGSDISHNGGKYSTKVNDTCTHLVASQKDFYAKSNKVQQAGNIPVIQVVSLDWLVDSMNAKKKISEAKYTMSDSAAPATDGVAKSKGKSKKRAPETDEDEEQEEQKPPAKKVKDGQKAQSGSMHIPVDEGCSLAGSHRVYIDDDGMIYDASLNQTNVGNNNNKFYRLQVLASSSGNKYSTWTRWGRVGEHGQSAIVGDGDLDAALMYFEKKFKDKSGLKWSDRLAEPKKGKYTFIERNYEEDSNDSNDDDLPGAGIRRGSKTSLSSQGTKITPESALPKPVQQLMELIFNQQLFANTMSEMSYDANKLPLGKLSKRTLMTGFERLKDLAELLADPKLAVEKYKTDFKQAIEEISNSFYTTIPHSFGRNRPPLISTENMLKREIELLESLSDMEIANEIMKDATANDGGPLIHQLDRQFAGLGLQEMTPIKNNAGEYKQLEDYLIKSHGATHHLRMKVQDIFRIERKGEFDRFAKSPYAQLKGDRRLLWHGSRCTNYGGILSQGLRIAPPEAPVSGYMFGKGVYLADISSKSANYCWASSSGNIGLLLLCEAELGKPMYQPAGGDSNAGQEAKKKGLFSTWGRGITVPKGWKDASCVHKDLKGVMMPDTTQPPSNSDDSQTSFLQYNEYIAYDVAQIRLRYLLRVEMN